MNKHLWNTLWKKKLLHRTQEFSFQNCFTICCFFFVVFSPTLKKTRLFCFGKFNPKQTVRCKLGYTTVASSLKNNACVFFPCKTVFLYRKKKNSQILFVCSRYYHLQMKLTAKWSRKKTLHSKHFFWQKQAVEVADTWFMLWKQTKPDEKTNWSCFVKIYKSLEQKGFVPDLFSSKFHHNIL